MQWEELAALLLRQGGADGKVCLKLSATKFVEQQVWHELPQHEQEFLRCYAVGVAARKAVVVGRSAAVLLGLWTLPSPQPPVTLANPTHKPPRRPQWPEDVEYLAMRLPPDDIVTVAGADPSEQFRVTSRVRTAVDIARLYGVRHGVVAMDSLFHGYPWPEQMAIKDELEETVRRLAGKRGIAQARQALEWSSMLSESPYESLFRVILRERGIIAREQMWIGPHARPDLLWDQLIIEIDGESKFDADPKRTALLQVRRENWLREQIYEVLRLFPREILKDEEACVRRVLELKARSETRGAPRVKATRKRPYSGEDWR